MYKSQNPASTIRAGEPVVVVVLSPRGLERSLVFYEEDNEEALEAGNLLLAKISAQLLLLDDALRKKATSREVAGSE